MPVYQYSLMTESKPSITLTELVAYCNSNKESFKTEKLEVLDEYLRECTWRGHCYLGGRYKLRSDEFITNELLENADKVIDKHFNDYVPYNGFEQQTMINTIRSYNTFKSILQISKKLL